MLDTSIDGHVHTSLCRHAIGAMEDYVHSAMKRGLKKIIFLEHLETGIDYFERTWLTDKDFDFYFQEGTRLQKKYRNKLQIGLGVEVGFNPARIEEINIRLRKYDWETIGISYHFLDAKDIHLNMVSSKQRNIDALDEVGVDKVVRTYYRDLLQAVLCLPGTVLCHMDAVLRYHPDNQFPHHETLIDRVLDAVVQKNMAIEVNTSGFKLKNEPYPSISLLAKIIKRGIPLVAGSDAHRPEDVGRYFDKLEGMKIFNH